MCSTPKSFIFQIQRLYNFSHDYNLAHLLAIFYLTLRCDHAIVNSTVNSPEGSYRNFFAEISLTILYNRHVAINSAVFLPLPIILIRQKNVRIL